VDQDEDGLINSVEFCMLMKRLRARNELYPIFQRYASNKVTLSAKDFQKFLREEQKVSHSSTIIIFGNISKGGT
jgi:hypothetical protein